jgi:small subunit ribosomal protein S8
MTMTDPIADMLTRIRNANSAYQQSTNIPSSRKLVEIARILKEEGYIEAYDVVNPDAAPQDTLVVTLKYRGRKERTISGLRRISKPGLRVYAKKDELPRVLGGLGIAIISTSSGVMTDKQARKAGVGGEVVAYVW